MRTVARLSPLWVAACLAALLAGALAYTSTVLRDTLQAEVQARDAQTARLLAASITAAEGDSAVARRVMEAAFDPSRHDLIRLVDAQGRVLAEWPPAGLAAAANPPMPGAAARADPVAEEALSAAPFMAGTRLAGQVQVRSRAAAWGAPWRDALSMLALGLAAMGLTAGALLAFGAMRSRQAWGRLALAARRMGLGQPAGDALPLRGELATLSDDLTAASQRMARLQQQVEEQAQAVVLAAHTDALTGLHNRVHFRALLQRALESEPPPAVIAGGSLLIVRLRRLEAMNLRVGYDQVDGMVRALAGVANSYPPRVPGAFAGRLNGGDVGLYLPVPGVALSTAEAIWGVMRTALMRVDPAADMAIGGVEGLPWGSASRALAAADEALARAEAQGAFSIVVSGSSPDLVRDGVPGDGSWRQRIAEALDGGEVRLAEAPVLGPDGALIHLSCSLQVRLSADGPFAEARPRLLLDTRSLLTRRVDLATVATALRACALDGLPRCAPLSIHSAQEPDFLHEVGRLLEADPQTARLLCLRVEADPARLLRWVQEVPAWRQLGVGFVAQWPDLAEGPGGQPWEGAAALGLRFVNLPMEQALRAGQDPARRSALLRQIDRLKGQGIAVLAQGAAPPDQLSLLRELGITGFEAPSATG